MSRAAFLRNLGIAESEMESPDAVVNERPGLRARAAASGAAASGSSLPSTASGSFGGAASSAASLRSGGGTAQASGAGSAFSASSAVGKPAANLKVSAAAAAPSTLGNGGGAASAESATELKQRGNECFQNGDFRKAVRLYTEAIKKDPESAALYSNRSVAYLEGGSQMGIDTRSMALRDALRAVELKPDWAKAHFRQADALFALERFDEAVDAYDRGLALDADNDDMRRRRDQCRAMSGSSKGPRGGSEYAPGVSSSSSSRAATEASRDASFSSTSRSADASAPEYGRRAGAGAATTGRGFEGQSQRMSARDLLEEFHRRTDAQRGNDFREAELERFRSRRSCNSSTGSASDFGTSSSFASQTPPVASATTLRSESSFSSADARNYQKGLLEAYRRKRGNSSKVSEEV